ncbi:MAG: glycosyltransferase family 39 protein, partial [Ardenticatenaceae bacterium]
MKASPLAPRRQVLLLTFLAAALQFWALDAQSLWYDEGFSVWLAQRPLSEIVARTAADIHPPFYYLLLHGWIALTGSSEWALRFLSALFAVLTVPLVWQLARRLIEQEAAAIAVALLVVLSPLLLWYGREARMYSLSLALLAATALVLLRLLGGRASRPDGSWQDVAAFAVLATVAVYTHFYIWFVLTAWAIVAGWVWLQERLGGAGRAGGSGLVPPHVTPTRLAPTIIAFAMPLLSYMPWLGITLRRLRSDRSYWEGTLSLREVVEQALASWMTGHTVYEGLAVPLGWLGGALALGGAVLLAWRVLRPQVAGWSLEKLPSFRKLPAWHWLLIVLWLLLPFIGLLALSWNRPKYHPRYLIFAAPAFLFLLGALIGWLWRRRWSGRLVGTLLLLGVLGIFLLADWNLFANPAYARSDWRALAHYLQAHRGPGEPILLISGHAYPVFHYYYPSREEVLYLPDEPTLDTSAVLGLTAAGRVAEKLEDAPGVWVVEWQDEVVDPEGVIHATLRAGGASVN